MREGGYSLQEMAKMIRERINRWVTLRRDFAEFVRKLENLVVDYGELGKSKVILEIPEFSMKNFKVAGIDGGLLKSQHHGVDLVMVRAVGVVFSFTNGRLSKVEYLGDDAPKTHVEALPEGVPLDLYSSIKRVKEEVRRAIDVVLTHAPDFLLLDGPVYPHPSLEVASSIEFLKKDFEKVLELYGKLERTCKEYGCVLAGVVEDSKSSYFFKEIKKVLDSYLPSNLKEKFKELGSLRDTVLLSDVLRAGEMTFPFIVPLKNSPYSSKILATYVRISKLDRPYRLEVCAESVDAVVEVASLAKFLSAFSRYSLPSVLVEADLKARLNRKFEEYFLRLINLPYETSLIELRRRERVI